MYMGIYTHDITHVKKFSNLIRKSFPKEQLASIARQQSKHIIPESILGTIKNLFTMYISKIRKERVNIVNYTKTK